MTRLLIVAAVVIAVLALMVYVAVRVGMARAWRDAEAKARWEPEVHHPKVKDGWAQTDISLVLVATLGKRRRVIEQSRWGSISQPVGTPAYDELFTGMLGDATAEAVQRNVQKSLEEIR